MAVIVGIAGARRNAAVALCRDGRATAFCEEERATRARQVGLRPGRLPVEALSRVLQAAGRVREDVTAFALGEPTIELPPDVGIERVDHHQAHAATAFYTSPFDEAIVLVCDRHGSPELTVWRGRRSGLERLPFPWAGPAFASVYSHAAEALGFAADGDEHRIEALARVATRQNGANALAITSLGDRLEVPAGWQASVAEAVTSNGRLDPTAHLARVAERIQRQLGALLLDVVAAIKRQFDSPAICLGGGLFYNSYFTTLVAQSGVYERTFVPVNPGNAGAALGAAFVVGGRPPEAGQPEAGKDVSAFLGPEYAAHEIKATLDNCKLSYDYLHEDALVERAAQALSKGRLVGWFQGRMEWGARALGNRSILANPVDPYVLENLNAFLKHRAPHRCYSVSVCAEDVGRFFAGPSSSTFMEYEHEVLDREQLRHLLPLEATRIRVQTVPASAGIFHRLIRACGEITGVPLLVNTSFNGFNEPIVCTPRDAVRVFYGTGLDMAVLGNLVLHK
jgi:carbamoyltransferase